MILNGNTSSCSRSSFFNNAAAAMLGLDKACGRCELSLDLF